MNRRSAGFTLVEMITVIAIIGILTVIVSASFSQARANARDKARMADIASFQQALRLYAEENGQYPDFTAGVGLGVGNAIDDQISIYLSRIPMDPKHGDGVHTYWYDSEWDCDGTNYVVVMAVSMETVSGTNYTEMCEDPYVLNSGDVELPSEAENLPYLVIID